MSKQAVKNDQGKSDISQVSWELVDLLGQVRMFGEMKYSRGNWKSGFKVTRSCAAALRHIFQFLSGETLDPESGLLHLGHAVASLEHAIYDMKHHPYNDDRDKQQLPGSHSKNIFDYPGSSEDIENNLKRMSERQRQLHQNFIVEGESSILQVAPDNKLVFGETKHWGSK